MIQAKGAIIAAGGSALQNLGKKIAGDGNGGGNNGGNIASDKTMKNNTYAPYPPHCTMTSPFFTHTTHTGHRHKKTSFLWVV